MKVAMKVVAKVALPPEPPDKRVTAPAAAFIGIGGNLGQAQASVLQAVQDIGALPGTTLLHASSLYRTAPVDSSGPDYINAVVEISTTLGAHALLAQLQALENKAGRHRPFRNAPRTLDLDILLYGGDQAIITPTLEVPHPRMAQRAFVLVPLAEIAPSLVTVAQLHAVRNQAITRI